MLRIFPGEPEIMGLLALMLLQISRRPARFNASRRDRAARRSGPIAVEPAADQRGACAARQGDPPPAARPYQFQAAIAALHARAQRAGDTDWEEIELLYRALERMQPSPVITLNRAVACRS
jgi:RNA polymerase sigma-70 factor (ECF subfamily)